MENKRERLLLVLENNLEIMKDPRTSNERFVYLSEMNREINKELLEIKRQEMKIKGE